MDTEEQIDVGSWLGLRWSFEQYNQSAWPRNTSKNRAGTLTPALLRSMPASFAKTRVGRTEGGTPNRCQLICVKE